MSGQVEGFRITPARVAFFLSLVAAVSVFKPIYTYLSDQIVHETVQDNRITKTEQDVASFRGDVKELKGSIDGLKDQVVRLTIVLEGQDRKKALLTLPAQQFQSPRDIANIE
ncbi:hypothetical protein [Phyllobacterium myrsinacearum]|uniref:Uncharacterized protein YlxW (UPF0749 family) n=1 Tax=Phyllobacterium myrsinacearum TaxID=28101 RepID=A0A839ESG6_9HYPH|nr:hypothetical protein [Phyllobacterium myrsinacearum]MBA8881742.1 uncharacterized protein YlxW (UPF0749 family) [Phyllobacterium myrsinacearum]